MPPRAAIVGVGVGALLGACSLASLDGYSGGVAPSLSDGGGGDDGAPAPDAGVDAPAATFCARQPSALFCSDFDDGGLPAPWSDLTVSGGSTLALDDALAVSPPRSIRVETAATSGEACLSYTVATAPSAFSISVDVRVESLGPGDFDLFTVRRSTERNVGIEVRSDGKLWFDENIPPVDGGSDETFKSTTGALPTGKWSRVQLDVVQVSGGVSATLFVDGTDVGSHTPNPAFVVTPFSLQLGDCIVRPGRAGWQVRFDNFVFVEKK